MAKGAIQARKKKARRESKERIKGDKERSKGGFFPKAKSSKGPLVHWPKGK